MEIIKKRLKGLCALITAAAMSLSALTVPAAATEAPQASMTVYVTTEGKKNIYETFQKAEYVGVLNDDSGPITLDQITAKAQASVDEFHQIDNSSYSVAAINNTCEAISYVLEDSSVTDTDFDNQHDLVVRARDALNSYSYKAMVFVLTAKAKNFTIPVYCADRNVAFTLAFTFTTDCDSKYFPIDELNNNLSCSLTFEYKYSYANTTSLAQSVISGDQLWKLLENARNNENTNGGTFSMDNLKLTINYPIIHLIKLDKTANDFPIKGGTKESLNFTDIVNGKNDYFNSRLTDNDFWAMYIHGYNGDSFQHNAATIKGSELLDTLKEKSKTLNGVGVTLTHIDKIDVVNNISGDPVTPDYSAFFNNRSNFNFDNMTEYTIDHLPVTVYELARKAGIAPNGAAYDAALYTPSSWTVWGGCVDEGSGKVSTTTKVNGKFENKDDFDFNSNAGSSDVVNLPILQVHEMKLLEVEIPCDDVTGRKLVYTAADHSDFPTKANAKSWSFTYDGRSVEVKNADELWQQIEKIIVTDGKTYDSALAKLTNSTCAAGHKWSKTYKSDKNGHWKICEVCNAVSKKEAHTPGKLSADHKQTCTTCGYLIKTVSHSYGTAWKSNSTSHWHECSCGDKTDIAKHTSDNGTITVQPTATSAGTMTYSCKVCGYVIKTTAIPATGTPNYPNRPSYPTNTSSTTTADTASAKFTFDWNIQGKKVTLSWNDIPDAESYTVYRYKNGKYVKVKTTEKTSVTLKNLKNGETYKFMVKYTVKGKTCSAGDSGKFTGKFYYKPIAEATAGKNRIKLTWEKVSGAEKYAVYKYVDGKAVKLAETTKLSVNIKGLKSDKEYQYIVRAYVDGKWTDMKKSDIVTAKTKA